MDPAAIEIRDATEPDVAPIVALLADDALGRSREQPGDPTYLDAFHRMIGQSDNVYMVAVVDGALVGCLQYTVIHGLSLGGAARAQIEGVRVASSKRGSGIGHVLLNAAIDRARADGCSLVQLTANRSRTDALRFYEDLGFVASHHGLKLSLP